MEEAAAFQLTFLSETLWLLSDERIDFSDPALLTIKLEDLRIPLSEFTSPNPDAYGFKAYLKLSQPQEKRSAKKEVQGLHIEALLEAPLTDKKITFGLKGKGEFNGEAFSMASEVELEKPRHPIRFEEVLAQNFQGKCTFTHLPFKWFSIFEEHLVLSKLLGSHADLFCEIASSKQKSPQITVSLSTPKLSIEAAQFNLLPELSLISPAVVHWKGDQECLKPFLGPHLRLNRPCELWLQVKELALPMRFNQSIQIKAEAAVQGLEFLSPVHKTFVVLDDCLLKCEGSLPAYLNGELTSRLAVTQIDHSPHALLPNPLSLKFNLNFEHRQDELYAVPNFDMHLFSEEMEVKLGGRVDLKEGVLATDELVCHFLLTPQGWGQLETIGGFSKLHLKHPTQLTLRVRPTRFMLESGWLSQIRSEGTFHADQLVFVDMHGALSYIDQIDLPWKIEGPENQITATLKSGLKVEKKAKAAPLFATLKLDNWLIANQAVFEQAKFEFTTELRSLATPFFAVWLNLEDPTPLIGPLVDLDLKTSFDFSKQNPGYWDMHLDSTLLHLKARIKVGDTITLYQSNKPTAEVRWTMTPEGYHYLENLKGRVPAAFPSHLAKPVVLTAYLSMLDLPLKTADSWIDGGSLEGYLSTSEFVWMDAPDLPHMKLEAELKSQNLIEKIAVKAKIEGNAPSTAHFTPLLFSANLYQVIDSMGHLKNGPETTIQALLEMSQFPLISLKHALLIDPHSFKALEAFWGKQIDGTCKLDMQHMDGTFTAQIKGPNGSSSLSGKMQNGIFKLSSPFEVHMDLSPAMISFFSDQSIPLLESVLSASETLDLVIEPKNFSLPLVPFDPSEWTIGKGKLNLGKIFFKNEKDLETITSLIPSLQEHSFAIWFTPIYFSLDQNQLALERFDMQVAGKYTLASWGTIQLESMKTNLILGLSSDTLRSVFHIDPDEGYFLQIPIKGKHGKLGIDKTKALARIGALAAQTQGGIQGKIVGSLLDATLSENLEFSPPSPTTSPFPWEGNGELEEEGTQIDVTKNKVSVKKKANKKQQALKIDPEPLIKGLLERLTR